MTPREIAVLAVWDAEAEVFVLTSDDVPGLVAEAADMGEIDAKLQVLIPELLELNGLTPGGHGAFETVPVIIRIEQKSSVRIPA
jgi:hypothetical protein